LETAKRRSIELDAATLAKLMVLEQAERDFQQLFLWQLAQHGTPEELAVAESSASSASDLPGNASEELKAWFASPAVRNWLGLEPHLSGVPLGEYFFFSRDRLSPAAPEARLSTTLQALLSRLQLPTAAQRRTAVEEAAKLSPEEYTPLYEALLDRAGRRPDSEAMHSALELTEKVPTSWPTFSAVLSKIPPKDIPIAFPPRLAVLGKDRSEVRTLFEQWEASGAANLKKAVIEARRGLA
jgi:hypothetical protein